MMTFGKDAAEHNAFMLERALCVLRLLERHMFDATICGGLCRDTILNRYAKDVDIVVYNWHPNDVAEKLFFEQFSNALKELSPHYTKHENYEDMENNDFELRQIREVYKARVDGVDIDIIFIEDCHPIPEGLYARFNKGKRRANLNSVLSDFDCPVNMFYYDEVVERMLFVTTTDQAYLAKENIHIFLDRFVCKLNLGDERLCRNYGRLKAFNSKREELLPHFCISTPIKTNEDPLV